MKRTTPYEMHLWIYFKTGYMLLKCMAIQVFRGQKVDMLGFEFGSFKKYNLKFWREHLHFLIMRVELSVRENPDVIVVNSRRTGGVHLPPPSCFETN